jgi:hypothetical protein
VRAEVVNGKDVRMIQCGGGACFLLEAAQPIFIVSERSSRPGCMRFESLRSHWTVDGGHF